MVRSYGPYYLGGEDVPIVPTERSDAPSCQEPQSDHDAREDEEDDQHEGEPESLRYGRMYDEEVAVSFDCRHLVRAMLT